MGLHEQYPEVTPGYDFNKIIITFNYTVKVKFKYIQGRFTYYMSKSFDPIKPQFHAVKIPNRIVILQLFSF